MSATALIQIITAMIGSLGFAILFNIRGKQLPVAFLGGGLTFALFLLLDHFVESEMLCYFLVALTASLYAEVMARVLRSPATVFIAPCLIPMVPGASLYYTMSHALNDNAEGFIEKGTATLQIAAALAVGVIVSTVFMRIILNAAGYLKAKK